MYCADRCPIGLHRLGQTCTDLIETTADALSGSAVALMLLTVQKDNLELNVNQAVKWYVEFVRMSGRNCSIAIIGPILPSNEGMGVRRE